MKLKAMLSALLVPLVLAGSPPPAEANEPAPAHTHPVWNACSPLKWSAPPHPDSVGYPGWLDDFKVALATVTSATQGRVQFRQVNTSTQLAKPKRKHRAFALNPRRKLNLQVQWITPVDVPNLEPNDKINPIGIGYTLPDHRNINRASWGYVGLDASDLPLNYPREIWALAMVHEMGHVIGLDHNPDPASILHPEVKSGQTFTASDLQALSAQAPERRCTNGKAK